MTTKGPARPDAEVAAAACLLVVAALVVGCVVLWPLPVAWSTSVPDTRFTDGHLTAFGIGADPRTLWSGTQMFGWPHRSAFTPVLWPGLLLARVVGPVAALNLTCLAIPLFNAACGWMLARELSASAGATAAPPVRSAWQAAAAGALLAWNPWVHNAMANGQFELAVIGGAALIWGVGVRSMAGGPGSVLTLGIVTAAVAFAAPYPAAAGAACLGIWGLSRVTTWRALRTLLARMLPVALALACANLWHGAAFETGASTFAPKGTSPDAGLIVATIDGLLLPPRPDTGAPDLVHCRYVGWTWALMALWTLVPWAARKGVGDAPKAPQAEWPRLARAVLLCASLGSILLALGPYATMGPWRIPLPMAALMGVSDTVAQNANPYRFLIGAVTALSALAATSVTRGRAAALLVLVAWAETAWTRTRPIPMATRPAGLEPMARLLAEVPPADDGLVLDLPPAVTACATADHYAAQAAVVHGHPLPLTIRQGWSAYGDATPLVRTVWRTLREPGCAERLEARLSELPLRAVVVHHHPPCAVEPAVVDCLTRVMGAPRDTPEGSVWLR